MIWYYDIEASTISFLLLNLPYNSFRSTSSSKALDKNVKWGDLVIFFNYKHTKLYDSLIRRGAILFPSSEITYFVRNRSKQLRILDTVTKFPLRRIYIDNYSGIPVPNKEYPILKIGNNHQGIGKYRYPDGPRKILYNGPVVYEEFVEDHRGIRVLIIGLDIFIIEQINDQTWIKNDTPSDEITYHWNTQKDECLEWLSCSNELVVDALKIASTVNSPLLGVDYAVGSEKIGLLEINDMVGIPDNRLAMDCYNKLLLKICKSYLEK